ncbi:hypothetical protein ACLOJK_005456 [Asimina triloba]
MAGSGEAEEGREGKGKRERGPRGDGCGGTAACTPADDDDAAGKRTLASSTPCCLAGSKRAEDVVADALQPCRKRKGKGQRCRCSPAGDEREGGVGAAGLPETKGVWVGMRGYRSTAAL